MSRPNRRTALLNGCRAKRWFRSSGAAWAAIRAIQRSPSCKDGEGLAPYLCIICHRWHFGHGSREREIRSVIPSVFQSRQVAFAKIRCSLPIQGGRVESNRARH